jgi:class I fructose-bisphosphate aldolase
MASKQIVDLLGDQAAYLLDHQCTTVDKKTIHLPSPDHIEIHG